MGHRMLYIEVQGNSESFSEGKSVFILEETIQECFHKGEAHLRAPLSLPLLSLPEKGYFPVHSVLISPPGGVREQS